MATKTTPKGERAVTPSRSMRHFKPRPKKPGIGRPAGGHMPSRSLGGGGRR